ncbi:hypothetical protein [Microcoleus sp. herbarium12]|uniref:hypothetical protein n=1 Tax=Microcoleus sp. herbarium12 TaxID=3055437 RepID=UPI002FD68407
MPSERSEPFDCGCAIAERLNLNFVGGVVEFSIANFLVLVAFVLLVTVTGGVAYLTAVEWRDRRRLDRVQRKK